MLWSNRCCYMMHVPSFRYFMDSICCVIARTSWNPVLSPDMCWKYASFSTCTDRLFTPASFKMAVTYESGEPHRHRAWTWMRTEIAGGVKPSDMESACLSRPAVRSSAPPRRPWSAGGWSLRSCSPNASRSEDLCTTTLLQSSRSETTVRKVYTTKSFPGWVTSYWWEWSNSPFQVN